MNCSRRALASLSLVLAVSASAQEITIPGYCSRYPMTPGTGTWQSAKVQLVNGRLTYPADSARHRLADFSYAGYRYGQVAIPNVPEVSRLSATTGDQTARIQAAIDAVGARTPDARGLRGALVLSPGTYTIAGVLRIPYSGVVLRGSGDDADPAGNTILRVTGDTPHQRSAIVLGSGNETWTESATARTNVTTSFVQVGAMSFDVASTAAFAVGDDIVVKHPSTQAWIDALGGGGNINNPPWPAGSMDIPYYRRITRLSGNTVTLDAPVFNHLDRSLSQSYIAKVTSNMIRESGVEGLRVDIVTAAPDDENHAWHALTIHGAQDVWVRDFTGLHFGWAAVRTWGVLRATVAQSRALDPHAIRTGARMYNFGLYHRSQLILFTGCEATNGRHVYVSNGTSSASGVVFHRSLMRGGNAEGHRKWSTGLLFDNMDSSSSQILLFNRGDSGDTHGWSSAHSLIWRFNRQMVVQKPPTAQNFGISDMGSYATTFPNPGPLGYVEVKTTSGKLVPESLYEAQLCERLETGEPPTPTPTPTVTPTPATPTPTPTPTLPGAFVEITPAGSAVTASTHDGNLPANTVDNSLTTRWSANGDGQWIRYDLGSVRTVAHVTIAVYNGNSRQNRFDLQVSNDNVNWTTVLTGGLTSGTTTAEQIHDFADVDARYVRYLGHGSTVSTFNSVTEVSLFAPNAPTPTATPTLAPTSTPTPTSTPVPTSTPTPGGTPVEVTPPGSAVTASTSDVNVPANTVDDNLGTRWSGNGDGAWIQYDLGATRTITHVKVAVYSGNARRNRFDLQASTGGGVWTTLWSGESSGTTTAEETYDVPDTPARWIRYVGHGSTSTTFNSVSEVSIFAVP